MKVILMDDDELVCFALKTILEASNICVLAIGHHAKDALALYELHNPDIMIMDIRMGEMSGLDGAQMILDKHSDAKILFLTTFTDDEYIIRALRMGAKGYFLKQNYEGIAYSLQTIQQGQSVFGECIVSKIPGLLQSNYKSESNDYRLTSKEMDLVRCVADGLSNKEIAATLFLSEGTVRNYLSIVCDKLNVKNRTQLVIFYYQNLK